MEIVDPALDFLEFILLLAGIVGICMGLILPMIDKVNEMAYEQLSDKTIPVIAGEKQVKEVDGLYTLEQICLAVSSQNAYLASPRKIPNIEDGVLKYKQQEEIEKGDSSAILVIGDEEIQISGRAQYDVSTASGVKTKITDWYCNNVDSNIKDARFKVLASMGLTSDADDNVYMLYYYKDGELLPSKEYK